MRSVSLLVPLGHFRKILNWNPQQETEMAEALAAVHADFYAQTNRIWVYQADELTISLPEDNYYIEELYLRAYPVDTAAGFTLYEREIDDTDWTETDDTDFEVDETRGIVTKVRDTPWLPRVKIEYFGGFNQDDENIPGEIVYAIALQTRFTLIRNSVQNIAFENISVPGASSSKLLAQEMVPQYKTVVNRYTRRAVNY